MNAAVKAEEGARWQDEVYDLLRRVKPTEPPSFKRDLDPARCRVPFKLALPPRA